MNMNTNVVRILLWVCFLYTVGVLFGCDRVNLGVIADTPAALDTVDQEVVEANTLFGFKLLAELREIDENPNTLISPFSISLALAMARNGAAGETEIAMRNALQLQGLDPQSLNTNYVMLQNALQAPDAAVTLSIANSLWGAEGIAFDPGFLDRNNDFLDTEIATLDFTDPANVSTINESVAENTGGGIPQMMPAIDPATVLCLISGIYFKGSWQEAFEVSRTDDRPFYVPNGETVGILIPMMQKTDAFAYYAGNGFQAVRLPYSKGQMGMYIFLPDRETDIDTFLADLNLENWQVWMSGFSFYPDDVEVVLPKFRLEYAAELREALSQLGMGVAFDSERADLSPVTTSEQRLYLSYISHTAVVEVNEEGTEARTGTFVYADAVDTAIPQAARPPIPFIVDRPFFFAIRDDRTQTVLFMGVVVYPQGRDDDREPLMAPFFEPLPPDPPETLDD